MSGDRLYFAYGSNMNPQQMASRCPGARFLCRATLANHRLDFTRDSPARGCGVADVVASHGDRVWGIVWRVSEAHLATLDCLEGHGTGEDAYRRVQLPVRSAEGEGEDLLTQTYEVARKVPFVRPDRGYLELLIQGARHWRLPPSWLEALADVQTTEDGVLERRSGNSG